MKRTLGIAACVLGMVALGAVAWLWLRGQQPSATPSGSTTPAKTEPTKPAPSPPPPSYEDTVLAKMSLREKVASLLMINTPGMDANALGQYVSQYGAGGFIVMGSNVPTSDGQMQLISTALRGDDKKLPRLVGIDQEGGTVRRLMGDNYASALTLKNQPVDATTQAFTARSAMVQSVGVTLNFGIIADTTNNPASFIYDRVLGTTPQAAADRVAAAVKASQGKTLTTIKHFPGHGETTADSHVSIPTTDISFAEWQARDKLPFQAGVTAGVDVVMMGHLRYSAVDSVPASVSTKWHSILRGDLGFKGVIITDAMGMLEASGDSAYVNPVNNAVMALQAGSDLLLYVTMTVDPNQLVDGIVAAVNDGRIKEASIQESAERVMKLRSKSAALVTN
jgi:beta-N-acetylhexosaminidase